MLIQKNVLMITERQKIYHNYVSRNIYSVIPNGYFNLRNYAFLTNVVKAKMCTQCLNIKKRADYTSLIKNVYSVILQKYLYTQTCMFARNIRTVMAITLLLFPLCTIFLR